MPSARFQRLVHRTLPILLGAALLATPFQASAQGTVLFDLRPHCTTPSADEDFGGPLPDIQGTTKPTDEGCPSFPVADPQNRQTPPMTKGQTLDVDIVLQNPNREPINAVRSWIAYDPTMLEGIAIKPGTSFNVPVPGEGDFVPDEGYIKLAFSSTQAQNAATIVLARITMTIIADTMPSTVLSFAAGDGTTAISMTEAGAEDVATPAQASLIVRVVAASSSTASSVTSKTSSSTTSASSTPSSFLSSFSSSPRSSTSTSSASSASSASSSSSSFTFFQSFTSSTSSSVGIFRLLQVENLRVSTQGSSIFVAWNPLGSTELAGYSLYYSTVSGKYIHRRNIPKPDTSVTIRALPEAETYYLAIRGVNAHGLETEFSQEVAVTVGNPTTATSPLTAASIPPGKPATGGTIAGSAGAPVMYLLFVAISAIIGTAYAFRRQLLAAPTRS